jgi:chemotaxis protein MotA
MLLLIGFIIVIASMLGGFMIAGGQPLVLLHVSEFVIIGGVAIGILVIASPMSTLKSLVQKIVLALSGAGSKKGDFTDLLKMLFELFTQARRGGLIAIEDDIMNPKQSAIISKYPSFLKNPDRVNFLCDCLKPIIDGRVKPDQLGKLIQADVEAIETRSEHSVHVLQLIGDSLPGVGIIAAVLGIINTMAAIADGPEAVGERVAAALTGTFLGVLGAYGFVNPLAARIASNNSVQNQYYVAIVTAVSSFTGGMAPMMAIEAARRVLDHSVQPTAEALEEMLKGLGTASAEKK